MEPVPAAKLPKKKINKGKLKKTIKNVLSRPDPVFWPVINEVQREQVEAVLGKYKVDIPVYKKPLWKDIKSIPKENRPKPPKIKKVEGLLFGISECSTMIENKQCSAVIIELTVNPRTIVQPILEACANSKVPAVCVDGLRKSTAAYFGIPTSCLGIKKDFLDDICKTVTEFSKDKEPKTKPAVKHKTEDREMTEVKVKDEPMETESTPFQYLFRSNKKKRMFIPPSEQVSTSKGPKQFIGQDFIEFSDKPQAQDKKAFKKMIVKRISNNPKRTKVK